MPRTRSCVRPADAYLRAIGTLAGCGSGHLPRAKEAVRSSLEITLLQSAGHQTRLTKSGAGT